MSRFEGVKIQNTAGDFADIIQHVDDDSTINDEYGLVTASGLYARMDSSSLMKPLRADSSTHSIQVIDYEHHEVHSGSHYFISFYDDLSVNNVLQMTITTPNTTKWAHMVWQISVESETLWTLNEAVTINNALANQGQPYNNNRNSSNTSGLSISYETHTNTAGADTDVSIGGTISLESGIAGAGKDAGGNDRNRELILKQNEIYAFRFTANAAGYVNVLLEWYEHTDKD